MTDWPREHLRILRAERECKRALAAAQRNSWRWLLADRSSTWRAAREGAMLLAMREAILKLGARCWRLGWRSYEPPTRRFDDRGEAPAPEPSAMPQEWANWYEATTDETLGRYAQRIRREIETLVQKAAIDGFAGEQLTDACKRLVGGMTTWQAERIARTESMRMWNLGRLQRMEGQEEIVGYEYSVVLDSRTSHTCKRIAGLRVRRTELVYVPPLHPHCRTVLQPLYSWEESTEPGFWGNPAGAAGVPGFGAVPRMALSILLGGLTGTGSAL